MKRIKEFLFQQNLKWKYSNDTVHLTARKSFKIGFGAMFILLGVFFLLKNVSSDKVEFQSISSKPTEAFKILEPANKNKQVTLVLYREDCKACKNIETKLVGNIQKIEKEEKATIIVVDVNEMEQEQLEEIQERMPAIMIDKTKIPTPLVANLKIDTKGKIVVKEQSNTDDFREIEKVLNKSF